CFVSGPGYVREAAHEYGSVHLCATCGRLADLDRRTCRCCGPAASPILAAVLHRLLVGGDHHSSGPLRSERNARPPLLPYRGNGGSWPARRTLLADDPFKRTAATRCGTIWLRSAATVQL